MTRKAQVYALTIGVMLAFSILSNPSGSFQRAHSASYSTNITCDTSTTITIGQWDVPLLLVTYQVRFSAILSLHGSNEVSWNLDRELISPGESLSLSARVNGGEYSLRIDLRIIVLDKKSGDSIVDQTIGKEIGVIDVPGSWESPRLTLPVVPFEVFNIPVEISLFFGLSLSSLYSITINTYGLEQNGVVLEYSSPATRNAEFTKASGVGAKILLSKAVVTFVGSLILDAGLSVLGITTPLSVRFASVPIAEWGKEITKNINIATLKTPISIEVSANKQNALLGEPIVISGQINPKASNIPIQILAGSAIIGNVETTSDGYYSFVWSPSETGTYEVFARSPETTYTTSASSSSIEIVVREQTSQNPISIAPPLDPMILFASTAAAIVTVSIILYRRSRRKHALPQTII